MIYSVEGLCQGQVSHLCCAGLRDMVSHRTIFRARDLMHAPSVSTRQSLKKAALPHAIPCPRLSSLISIVVVVSLYRLSDKWKEIVGLCETQAEIWVRQENQEPIGTASDSDSALYSRLVVRRSTFNQSPSIRMVGDMHSMSEGTSVSRWTIL